MHVYHFNRVNLVEYIKIDLRVFLIPSVFFLGLNFYKMILDNIKGNYFKKVWH